MSIGQESGSSLAGWFWLLSVSGKVMVMMLAGAAVVWRLDWGWRIHFQDGSLSQNVPVGFEFMEVTEQKRPMPVKEEFITYIT